MPEQLESIWSQIREQLSCDAPDFQFHIWLEPLTLAGVEGTTLYVRAPEHIRTWVGERYLPLLRKAAEERFDRRAVVELVGEDWRPRADEKRAAADTGGQDEGRLNPKYTFEQFVIGDGSRFAHAAALTVAELPAQAYNPLFIHGAPGLGKTHLLHAIGNFVRHYGSGLTVRYATVEEFTQGFVDAIRDHRTTAFKDRFRRADVVLIDDVQFLARKERTREELFHTFNALYESGRQVVFTSDRHPRDLSELEARLLERFQCGLVVELEPPGFGVRRVILEKRATLDSVEVSPDVLDEIARCVTTSVRAIEGALIRVIAYASLRGEAASPGLVRHVLQRLGEANVGMITSIPEIVDATAQEFGVPRSSVLARDRRPEVAIARQVAMYLARELTDHSYPEIGRGIGDRSHTTVLHAVNRMNSTLRIDSSLQQAVDRLRQRLGPPA